MVTRAVEVSGFRMEFRNGAHVSVEVGSRLTAGQNALSPSGAGDFVVKNILVARIGKFLQVILNHNVNNVRRQMILTSYGMYDDVNNSSGGGLIWSENTPHLGLPLGEEVEFLDNGVKPMSRSGNTFNADGELTSPGAAGGGAVAYLFFKN